MPNTRVITNFNVIEQDNTLTHVLCQKLNLGETYYYQTVKLGTQSKLYEQNYSQMILAI